MNMNLETRLHKQPMYAPPATTQTPRMELPAYGKPIGYVMECGRFTIFENAFHAAHGTGPSNLLTTGMASTSLEGWSMVSMKEVLKPLDYHMPEPSFKPIKADSVLIPLAPNVHEHLVVDADGEPTMHSHLTIGTRHEFYGGEGNSGKTLNAHQSALVNALAERNAFGIKDDDQRLDVLAIMGRKR